MKAGNQYRGTAASARLVVSLFGALFAVSSACHSRDGLPRDRVWKSEHFIYYSRKDDAHVCAGVLNTLEKHFATLHRQLGFPWSSRHPILYYKFKNQLDLLEHGDCSGLNASCYFGARGIQSSAVLELHELIHAYFSEIGDSHRLLEEGIAEALSCAGLERSRPNNIEARRAFDPATWVAPDRATLRELYTSASWFVGSLLARFGAPAFLRLYETASRSSDLESLQRPFASIYGVSLTSAWQTALDGGDPAIACAPIWECAAPEWTAARPNDFGAACDGNGAFRSLEIAEPSFISQEPPGFGLRLGSCDPAHALPAARLSDELSLLGVAPGRYFLAPSTHSLQSDELHISPLGRSLQPAENCPNLVPLVTDFPRGVTFAFNRGSLEKLLGSEPRSANEPASPPRLWSLAWRDQSDAMTGSTSTYRVTCSPQLALHGCTGCDSCVALCDNDVIAGRAFTPHDHATLRLQFFGGEEFWVRFARVASP